MADSAARGSSLLRQLRARPRPIISSRTARVPAPHRLAPADRVLYNQLSNALADAAATHASGRLLDIGCGRKPWTAIFAPYVTEHIGVDPEIGSSLDIDEADIVADAYSVPLSGESADTVLLTEVLEHLEDPVRALKEAHRLLRPSGALILTTPLIFPVHGAPRDFFRYSPHGLEYVMRQAGFEGVTVRPLSGQWTTLAMLRGLSLYPFRRGRILTALVDSYCTISLALAVRLDEADFRDVFSWNHIATGRKP
jgi:SAM-dependent methyltransferase